MSASVPSTPEHAATKMPLTRSFTVPTKIATAHPHAEIGATAGLETLYVHPDSKVVKFSPAGGLRPGGGGGGGASTSSPGLPWTSSTETTVAAGPLEVYRVPGSVSFLRSGNLLHAVLPRSNCWCVDGVSKFALRVAPDTYYRIELPGDTAEDLEKVADFIVTLKRVLGYERTACPFRRAFSVDLPDEPSVRRKRRKTLGPAKKWRLDRANSWKPEDGEEPPQSDSGSESSSDAGSTTQEDSATEDGKKKNATPTAAGTPTRPSTRTPHGPSVKDRIRGLTAASRSFTAPPQLSTPSRLRKTVVIPEIPEVSVDPADLGIPEATEQRRLQPIPTDMPPSPPDSSAGYEAREPASADEEQDFDNSVLVHDVFYEDASAQTSLPPPTADGHDLGTDLDPDHGLGQVLATGAEIELDAESQEPDIDSHVVDILAALELQSSAMPDIDPDRFEEMMEATQHAQMTGDEADAAQHAEVTMDEMEAAHQALATVAEGAERAGDAPASQHSNSDPFAQIQARIRARRSIGGTTSFHPIVPVPTRHSSRSTASTSTSTGSSSSSRSTLSRRAQPQQAMATALVKKACSVFLGPPAHLVIIMLRIAKRFANGTFGDVFSWDSPTTRGHRRVPGSFDLDGSEVEDLSDLEDWEDDFGVPIRSPIRLAARGDVFSLPSGAGWESARRRSGWDVD